MQKYSFLKTLTKGAKYSVIFLLPILIDKFIISFPELAQLSVGGLLVMLVNYLKVSKGLKI